jgi:hypothetical protein
VVVGHMSTTNRVRPAFVATFASGTWSFTPVALGKGETQSLLFAVSCHGGGCWAVGSGTRWQSSWTKGFAYRVADPPR